MRFGPFLGIALLLFLLWIGGFVFFHIASFLIHILLILAVIQQLERRKAGQFPSGFSRDATRNGKRILSRIQRQSFV